MCTRKLINLMANRNFNIYFTTMHYYRMAFWCWLPTPHWCRIWQAALSKRHLWVLSKVLASRTGTFEAHDEKKKSWLDESSWCLDSSSRCFKLGRKNQEHPSHFTKKTNQEHSSHYKERLHLRRTWTPSFFPFPQNQRRPNTKSKKNITPMPQSSPSFLPMW